MGFGASHKGRSTRDVRQPLAARLPRRGPERRDPHACVAVGEPRDRLADLVAGGAGSESGASSEPDDLRDRVLAVAVERDAVAD